MPRAVTGEARTSAGLRRAMILGILVFVVIALFAAVVAFASSFTGDADVVEVAKLSGVIFYMFHNVGLLTEFPTFDVGALPGAEAAPGLPVGPLDLSFTISVALLLGTLLAIILLYRAGRRAAEEGGGSTGMRILQGAAVALPYALLAAVVSLVVQFEFELGPGVAAFVGPGGLVEITVPILAAIVWPLGIGVVAGGLGGYASARRDLATPTPGRFGATVSGAGRMLAAVLLAGFVGLLVLGALSPDLTASYFEVVSSGRSGLVLLLATILAVPNLALWGVTIGMGGSIVAGDYLGMEVQHVASLLEFPTAIDPSLAGGPLVGVGGVAEIPTAVAPIGYFAFIPLTLIALIIGGRMAAQRAGVQSAGQGALVGAAAGFVFGVAFFGLLALAGITISASVSQGGAGQAELARVGPSLLMGGLLGLVWGLVAGAIGGATGTGAEAPEREGWRSAPPPAAPVPAGVGPEETREMPVRPEPTAPPAGGGTGFEGLAAQKASLAGPEPEPEPPDSPSAPPVEEPGAPPSPPTDEPPAFEFTTPRAQWTAPPEREEPGERPEEAAPDEEAPDPAAGRSAPESEPPAPERADEPGGWTTPSEPEPWSPARPQPAPDEPSEAPPWRDPGAFEPRPWSTDEPHEAPSEPEEPPGPVTEPWVRPGAGEPEGEDEGDEDEEGPAPS